MKIKPNLHRYNTIFYTQQYLIQLQLQTSETEITKSEKDLPSLHGNSFGGVKVIPNKPIAIFLLKIYNNKDCNLFTLFFSFLGQEPSP